MGLVTLSDLVSRIGLLLKQRTRNICNNWVGSLLFMFAELNSTYSYYLMMAKEVCFLCNYCQTHCVPCDLMCPMFWSDIWEQMRVPRVTRGLTTDRPLPGHGPVRDAASLGSRPGLPHLAASQPRVLAWPPQCINWASALGPGGTGDRWPCGDTRGHEEPVTSGIMMGILRRRLYINVLWWCK